MLVMLIPAAVLFLLVIVPVLEQADPLTVGGRHMLRSHHTNQPRDTDMQTAIYYPNAKEKIEALEAMIIWLAGCVESGIVLGKDVAPLAASAFSKASRIADLRNGGQP